MKNIIQNETLGEIVFEESVWTGRKKLSINGKPLTKVDKTTFKTEDDKTILLSGNFLSGYKMTIDGQVVFSYTKRKMV